MEHRIEKDSMGEVRVPAEALYGASTQRAVDNFPISKHRFDRRFIWALGLIKGSACSIAGDLKHLDDDVARAIREAADEVMEGELDDHFVLDILQTGIWNFDEHQRERGDRREGQPDPRQRRHCAPQRSRQLRPVLQRRHSHRDSHGCSVGSPQRLAARIGRPGCFARGKGRRVRRRRQVGAHPSDGCHPGHPGSGVWGLGHSSAERVGAAGQSAARAGGVGIGWHRGWHGYQCPQGVFQRQ